MRLPARIAIIPLDDKTCELTEFLGPHPGRGAGSTTMRAILSMADELCVTLEVWPVYDDGVKGGLEPDELMKWYERLGFDYIPNREPGSTLEFDRYLVRKPRLSEGLVEETEIMQMPQFKNWFSGSKLVNSDGSPIRLYHGTSKDTDFKSFNVPENGAWFSTSPKDASSYAENNDSQGFKWDGRNYASTNTRSRVIPVYVRAVNPLYVDDIPEEVRTASARNDGDPTRAYRKAQREWFRKVRREGHDAVVIHGTTVVVLGSPNQIKSAISNRTFDPDKKSMTESGSMENVFDAFVADRTEDNFKKHFVHFDGSVQTAKTFVAQMQKSLQEILTDVQKTHVGRLGRLFSRTPLVYVRLTDADGLSGATNITTNNAIIYLGLPTLRAAFNDESTLDEVIQLFTAAVVHEFIHVVQLLKKKFTKAQQQASVARPDEDKIPDDAHLSTPHELEAYAHTIAYAIVRKLKNGKIGVRALR